MSSEAGPAGARTPHPVSVPGCPPFRLFTHTRRDDFISRDIAATGAWEPLETSVVLGLLRPGNVFVDLGANIGYYTVLGSLACGAAGRVHAFEPEPGNFALLEANIALNGLRNVTAVMGAAARRSGHAELFLSDDNQGDHRLYRNEGRDAGVRVRTYALDDWFAGRNGGVDLVKVDTQGFEAQILEGMSGLLAASRERVSLILEFWPFGLQGAGDSAERLVELVAPLGFKVRKIDEPSARLVDTSWPELLAEAEGIYHPDTQAFTNLLLTPP